jgi:hypothetical protein
MLQVQSTYEKHVAERRSYNFIPLSYEEWLSWRNSDLKKMGLEPEPEHKVSEVKQEM